MFLTNRSLLALWSAILFLALFVLVLGTVTQEGAQFPGWGNLLELICLFSMGMIQTELRRANPQTTNDDSVQEPVRESSMARFLGAVIYVAILFAIVVACSILTLFVQRLTQYANVIFWAMSVLAAVASMLLTLRSQRQVAFEKRKHIPSNSD